MSSCLDKQVIPKRGQSAFSSRSSPTLRRVGPFLQHSCDTYCRQPKAQVYPTGDTVPIEYSNYDDPFRSSDASTGAIYKSLTAVNERNQPLTETLGALTRSYSFAATTG